MKPLTGVMVRGWGPASAGRSEGFFGTRVIGRAYRGEGENRDFTSYTRAHELHVLSTALASYER
jgi:hypothetical protein